MSPSPHQLISKCLETKLESLVTLKSRSFVDGPRGSDGLFSPLGAVLLCELVVGGLLPAMKIISVTMPGILDDSFVLGFLCKNQSWMDQSSRTQSSI